MQIKPKRRSVSGLPHDFHILWVSQGLSTLGSTVSGFVLPLLVVTLTGSVVAAGGVAFSAAVAVLVARLPGGMIADRFDRRTVMIVCDLVRVVSATWLAVALLTGHATIVLILLVAIVDGLFASVFASAEVAALRRVVSDTQLPSALSRNQLRMALAALAGPPLGGLLFDVSHALPFLVDAASYLISMLSLRMLRTSQAVGAASRPRLHWTELSSGASFLWHRPFLRYGAAGSAVLNFVFGGLFLAVVSGGAVRGDSGLGLGTAISLGALGSLAGGLAAARAARVFSPRHSFLIVCWANAVVVLALAMVRMPIVLGVGLALCCLLAPVATVVMSTVQISATPDHLQGRVASAWGLLAGVAGPAGPLAAGFLVAVGPALPFAVFGGVLVVLSLFLTASPGFRIHGPAIPERTVQWIS